MKNLNEDYKYCLETCWSWTKIMTKTELLNKFLLNRKRNMHTKTTKNILMYIIEVALTNS